MRKDRKGFRVPSTSLEAEHRAQQHVEMLCQTLAFMFQELFIFHLHEEKYIPHSACAIYTVTIHRTNSFYPGHNISFKFIIYRGEKTKKELKNVFWWGWCGFLFCFRNASNHIQ